MIEEDAKIPETYLHVRDCKSGEEWIRAIRGNSLLDLAKLIRKWVKEEYGGELYLDGQVMPRLEGDYYARIMMDGRPPDSIICWDSGGFYLTNEPNALRR